MKFFDYDVQSPTLFKDLFYRNLKKSILKRTRTLGTTSYWPETDVRMKVKYKTNSHGYRSDEFGLNQEVLVLGCSQTFGQGIPQEFTWAKIFADSIGKSYANLAQPGDSAQAQVHKAFKYFEEFGHPEIVVASFPSTRLEMPYIPKKIASKFSLSQYEFSEECQMQQIFLYDDIEKFSKIPHNPEEVLPIEVGIFYSFTFIQILQQYCRSHNIKLIWNMWDDESFFEYAKTNAPKALIDYLHINFREFMFDSNDGVEYIGHESIEKAYILPECHQELKDHVLFYRAADYKPGQGNGHWGIHINQHIAEDFLQRYKRIKKL
jgi:hypothetical protein